MNPDDKNYAYVLAQISVFNAKIAGMVADNMQRHHLGEAMAWGQDDFDREINMSGLHHNAVLTTLTSHE